jgi:2-polyprenyl-3-methyl-5-hydroxy-6-metoxy-1,4-benzoquinol methylase
MGITRRLITVERLLQPQPGERLLDVACGNGLTSRRLATAKARVTAFDVSDAMIAIAADHTGGSTPLSWNGRFSEIPAALIVRLRRP